MRAENGYLQADSVVFTVTRPVNCMYSLQDNTMNFNGDTNVIYDGNSEFQNLMQITSLITNSDPACEQNCQLFKNQGGKCDMEYQSKGGSKVRLQDGWVQSLRNDKEGYSVSLCLKCSTQSSKSEVQAMFKASQKADCSEALVPT